jgi:hypothetical protein
MFTSVGVILYASEFRKKKKEKTQLKWKETHFRPIRGKHTDSRIHKQE